VLLGPASGELVDIDLDCPEALALADKYTPPTGAIFGRASKPRSHRIYIAPGAVKEAFADPLDGSTLLELRAAGRDGAAHQTLMPPSVTNGECREWAGEVIAPAVISAGILRGACAWLAVGSWCAGTSQNTPPNAPARICPTCWPRPIRRSASGPALAATAGTALGPGARLRPRAAQPMISTWPSSSPPFPTAPAGTAGTRWGWDLRRHQRRDHGASCSMTGPPNRQVQRTSRPTAGGTITARRRRTGTESS
jgi:hypothetical protein